MRVGETIDMKETGNTIRWFREKKGLKQYEVAEELDVAPSVYGRWERGLSLPSLDNAIRLANLLEVYIEDFVIEYFEGDADD